MFCIFPPKLKRRFFQRSTFYTCLVMFMHNIYKRLPNGMICRNTYTLFLCYTSNSSNDNLNPDMNQRKKNKPRYFYGWNIVAAAFLARLSYAEHFTSVLGLFFKPLQHEFGWSRSAIAGVQTTARVVEAAIAPIIGSFIDRYGPRVLMPVGSIIVGITMLAVTRVHELWQFYLLRGVLVALGFTLMGALVIDVAVNNWFIRKRGRAIAIARVGGNFSNFIIVPTCVFVIANAGWRMMFVIFAVMTWVTVLIPSAVFMRRRPEDMGLLPDGDVPDKQQSQNNDPDTDFESKNKTTVDKPEPIWTRREVLTTWTFWLITISFAINSMSFQGINISLAPYIQDLGYSDTMLAVLITFRAAVMMPAELFMGFLSEKAEKTSMRAFPFLVLALSAIFFCMAKTPAFLWLAISTYGLGAAGVHVIQEVLWANYYGRLTLGLVRSLAFFFSFGFGSIGPVAMNIVFDELGSYRPAFIFISGLFTVAAILIGFAKPVKAKRYIGVYDI